MISPNTSTKKLDQICAKLWSQKEDEETERLRKDEEEYRKPLKFSIDSILKKTNKDDEFDLKSLRSTFFQEILLPNEAVGHLTQIDLNSGKLEKVDQLIYGQG